MQRNTVTVRLSGDLGNTVEKFGVSPAEIIILRAIHGGDDTVTNIRPSGMDKVPHIQERARLDYAYGAGVVDQLFPGKLSQLPVSNSDIGIEQGQPEEAAAPQGPDAAKTDDGLLPDDLELIGTINAAKTKAELRDIAIANEVELENVPDRMDAIRDHIIKELFPNYNP
jgi:hypothetical protein